MSPLGYGEVETAEGPTDTTKDRRLIREWILQHVQAAPQAVSRDGVRITAGKVWWAGTGRSRRRTDLGFGGAFHSYSFEVVMFCERLMYKSLTPSTLCR